MKEYTHVIVGLGVGLFMMSVFNMFMRIGMLFYILGLFFVFFGFVNDKLDFLLSPDHNRIFLTHSPFSPILIFISVGFGLISSQLNEIFGIYLMFAVHGIFISHFLLDMLNPSGVPILPLWRVSLNRTRYDDAGWNVKLSFMGIVFIIGSFLLFTAYP